MNDLEARRYLHDRLYAPVFRHKVASMTGIQFESPEEEAMAQAVTFRMKSANARIRQAQQQTIPSQQHIKMALYSQMDQLAGNVFGDNISERDREIFAIANDPQIGPALDALNL